MYLVVKTKNKGSILDMDVLSWWCTSWSVHQVQKMRDYIDSNSPGRDWNVATSMVINEAAMQIMGDWAKGEFTAAGASGKDYICAPAPGTDGQFTFNIDSFAFFELGDKRESKAQQDLAKPFLLKTSKRFNLNKGSIPVRLDMDMSKFDQCVDSMATFKASESGGPCTEYGSRPSNDKALRLLSMTAAVTNFQWERCWS